MIKSKYISVIIGAVACLAILASAFLVYAANYYESAKTPEYQKKLFSGEVLSIDISVDEGDWQGLLDNATAKEYISGDLVIDGETFSTVGIRTKGNSSLSQVARSESDRYSLQFKFNHYVKGQTCYGLDSLSINNMVGDATYMKDYISYDIMRYVGVPSPLTTYASVTVNGEALGFYVVLERYDKAFLDREYNTSAGQLYNVKIAMGQRENFDGGDPGQQAGAEAQPPGQAGRGRMGMGMPGSRSGGGNLIYNGDDPSDYSSIFDNSTFSKVSDNDKQQVISAIKNLNDGTNLEEYWDVDEILRYLAAHTVLVNMDSYSSNMQQNYYIYERSGQLSILPWDYGLAFGGFQSGSAASVVNFPIDTPVSGVSMEDRPLINKLLEVDEYRDKYHQYLNDIVDGYFNGGMFETTVLTLSAKISEYVKNDPSAFYSYEKYEASLPALLEFGKLRAESIAGQLDGNIPSTTEGQNADSGSLVDASHISLSDLGTMGGGGEGGFAPGGMDRGIMQEAINILRDAPDGNLTDEQMAKLEALGISSEEIAQFREMLQNGLGQNRQPGGWGALPERMDGGGIQRPGGIPNSASSPAKTLDSTDWIAYGTLGTVLILCILLLARFKRRKLIK